MEFEKYLNDEDALQVLDETQWTRVEIEYGRILNGRLYEYKYIDDCIYAVKQESWLFDEISTEREQWFLFDRHRGIKKEFPELEGII